MVIARSEILVITGYLERVKEPCEVNNCFFPLWILIERTLLIKIAIVVNLLAAVKLLNAVVKKI
jgi:hypothetical protein